MRNTDKEVGLMCRKNTVRGNQWKKTPVWSAQRWDVWRRIRSFPAHDAKLQHITDVWFLINARCVKYGDAPTVTLLVLISLGGTNVSVRSHTYKNAFVAGICVKCVMTFIHWVEHAKRNQKWKAIKWKIMIDVHAEVVRNIKNVVNTCSKKWARVL